MSAKFLVVDDQADIRSLVQEILRGYGCDCELAESGQEALSKLSSPEQAACFDAILLDTTLPGLDGYQVLERLKHQLHTSEIPVILLSESDEGEEIIKGYAQGADYLLLKPFTHGQIAYGLDVVFSEEESDQKVFEL